MFDYKLTTNFMFLEENPNDVWIYCNDTALTPFDIQLTYWYVVNNNGVDEFDIKIKPVYGLLIKIEK